ncbi:hypothetical protein GGS23DRAFT_363387 [Durotheca rogersii]|uniref:uncharacterized protein n=1 Tax=Durotheca rogersii TaxID=419775 RepID=UPI0022200D9B|nr:uncharacterized protein GGS23DRAFT_363387 [Durotheca rogersii]KAI5865985.1 hypothetical protein GGS23DRAFT_363387 [Durotheca rogersii]
MSAAATRARRVTMGEIKAYLSLFFIAIGCGEGGAPNTGQTMHVCNLGRAGNGGVRLQRKVDQPKVYTNWGLPSWGVHLFFLSFSSLSELDVPWQPNIHPFTTSWRVVAQVPSTPLNVPPAARSSARSSSTSHPFLTPSENPSISQALYLRDC